MAEFTRAEKAEIIRLLRAIASTLDDINTQLLLKS